MDEALHGFSRSDEQKLETHQINKMTNILSTNFMYRFGFSNCFIILQGGKTSKQWWGYPPEWKTSFYGPQKEKTL